MKKWQAHSWTPYIPALFRPLVRRQLNPLLRLLHYTVVTLIGFKTSLLCTDYHTIGIYDFFTHIIAQRIFFNVCILRKPSYTARRHPPVTLFAFSCGQSFYRKFLRSRASRRSRPRPLAASGRLAAIRRQGEAGLGVTSAWISDASGMAGRDAVRPAAQRIVCHWSTGAHSGTRRAARVK